MSYNSLDLEALLQHFIYQNQKLMTCNKMKQVRQQVKTEYFIIIFNLFSYVINQEKFSNFTKRMFQQIKEKIRLFCLVHYQYFLTFNYHNKFQLLPVYMLALIKLPLNSPLTKSSLYYSLLPDIRAFYFRFQYY